MQNPILQAAAEVVRSAGYHAAADEMLAGRKPAENLIFAAKGMCRNGQAAAAARLLALCRPHGLCTMRDVRQAEYGAVPDPNTRGAYILTLRGQRLWCRFDPDKKYGDWVFARWLTGDPALLEAYHKAPRNGDPWPNDETEESKAAYAAYEASRKADHNAIKAKGLPPNHPYTLKWNHGGYGETSALESFKQGLASIKQKENQQ